MANNPEIALSIPFALDQFGNIVTTSDQAKIWSDRVRSAIGTTLSERVMRPKYGTKVSHAAFETSMTAADLVSAEVERVFHEQLPLLSFTSATSMLDTISGALTVDIVYELPNNKEASTQVGIAYITGTTQPYEELS